jgi:hypothetical protein
LVSKIARAIKRRRLQNRQFTPGTLTTSRIESAGLSRTQNLALGRRAISTRERYRVDGYEGGLARAAQRRSPKTDLTDVS